MWTKRFSQFTDSISMLLLCVPTGVGLPLRKQFYVSPPIKIFLHSLPSLEGEGRKGEQVRNLTSSLPLLASEPRRP